LVLSKIDYCTVVFEMPPNFAIKRLQKIERSAASLVFNRYCGDNEILALNSLADWLTNHRTLANNWPTYLELSLNSQGSVLDCIQTLLDC